MGIIYPHTYFNGVFGKADASVSKLQICGTGFINIFCEIIAKFARGIAGMFLLFGNLVTSCYT